MRIKTRLLVTALAFFSCTVLAAERSFYQLKIYQLKTAEQVEQLDRFLEHAYLPALHRAGIAHIGVFKPIIATDGGWLTYVFIPYTTYEQFAALEGRLQADKTYQEAGAAYLRAPYDQPPYDRMETVLMNAFAGSPQLELPALTGPRSKRVYELRSYESPTEALHHNKVDMFNTGDEIGLFKRLGFNAVFYGEVVAGSRMPNLMYLTTFENQEARDAHWRAFSDDDYWKVLKAMPEYQNNVSRNHQLYLYPTEYSDF